MAVYFTADQHFGHGNIIRYCDRPFTGPDEMDAALIANWNAVVGPEDTVHVLGDVAMGRREETLPLVGRLVGRKILYPGNHDRCWSGHGPGAARHEQLYLDAGFDAIRHGPVPLSVAGHEVLACHLPYRDDRHPKDRFRDTRPVDQGAWLLCGHVHEKWRQLGRMINVGVDVWNFAPVGEAPLAALLDRPPVAGAEHRDAAR